MTRLPTIHTFDADAVRLIQREIGTLRNRVHNLTQELRSVRSVAAPPRPFVGKTTTNAQYPSYPGSGCKFLVQRVDNAFNNGAVGACDTQATNVGQYVIARTVDGTHLTQNTEVLCVPIPGSHGGRWYAVAVEQPTDPGQILIRNDSGATVSQYEVLALNGVVNTIAGTDLATYQTSPPTFKGTKPLTGSPGDWGQYAVLQESIDNAATGKAIVHGLTTVRLFKPTTTYALKTRVDITDNSHLAQEYYWGAAELLDAETSGANRYGWIRLDSWYSQPLRATVNDASGLPGNGSGTCTISESSEDVTVYNQWMEGTHDFSNGDELLIWFDRDRSLVGSTDGNWMVWNGEC